MNKSITLLLLLWAAAVPSTEEVAVADTGVFINGDVTIGGLFPVSRDNCSIIDSQNGIQRMEAMIFSLMQANSDPNLLRYGRHKIRLGGLLFDTCSSSEAVKARVIVLLMSSFSARFAREFCKAPDSSLVNEVSSMRTDGGSSSPVLGVVGASSSHVTAQAAQLLRHFSVPLVSYASAALYLSDRHRFGLFARTVPPGTDHAVALAELTAHFNWTYVSAVYSQGGFDEENMQQFTRTANNLGVCIAAQPMLKYDAGPLELDRIVRQLLTRLKARVVVLFTKEDHTRMLLAAASRASVPPGHFVWLSGDGGGSALGSGGSIIARGSLVVKTAPSEASPNFTEYFTSLRPEIQRRPEDGGFYNKYFDRFWQQNFKCSLGEDNRTNESNESAIEKCSSAGFAMLPDQFKPDNRVQNVYDAVFAYAHGLDKAIKQVCLTQEPVSDTKANGMFDQCVRNVTQFPSDQLYKIMIDKNNSFINNAGSKVEFTENGDRIATYLISNYQRDASTRQYVSRVVGNWTKVVGLTLTPGQSIVWPDGSLQPPVSVCSDECAIGQRKVYPSSSRCCWVCDG